jgi:hypothetical protein
LTGLLTTTNHKKALLLFSQYVYEEECHRAKLKTPARSKSNEANNGVKMISRKSQLSPAVARGILN